jgi:hypothetical protein
MMQTMGPLGRVLELEYRDQQPKMKMDTSAFVVHFRGPDGDTHEHPLDNPEWVIHNPTLQFMALHDFKPTDVDGTAMGVEDAQWLLPIAPDGDDGYLLASEVLDGGVEALEDAEWFNTNHGEESTDGDHRAPHGGGGPDPSTGNRGGVEHEDEEGGVSAELTPEDDTGVEVIVE